jgi:Xaa-Pro aminopeptidase
MPALEDAPMTICRRALALSLVLASLSVPGRAAGQSAEEYQKRRQAVRAKMEPQSVLVLRGAPRQGDGRFRQENNLFYLTGLNEPGVSLVLFPERSAGSAGEARQGGAVPEGMAVAVGGQVMAFGGGASEILFVTPPMPVRTPARPGEPQAAAPTPRLERPGFGAVRASADFQALFENLLLSPATMTIYVDYERSRGLGSPLTADEQLFKQARDKGAAFTVKAASSLITPFRTIKSASEIELLKTAAAITAQAQLEAARSARPGLFEYQIQAVIEHVFMVNGAMRPGFATIVGSGPDSCILHWSENSRQAAAGDLAVLDIGAEYDMYTADITRTIPISGKFTDRQKAVYQIVLRANEAAIEMIGPGVKMADVNAKVNDIIGEGLVTLGLIKDKTGLRRYYTHGLSHPIGLQVHDVTGGGGQTLGGTLQPGMVITIEPGIYIREEGLGVRIEDDVLVTDTGHEVMTAAAPKSVSEIEALMKENGMNFRRYLIKR